MSLFPRLIPSSNSQRSEQTAVSHSVGRLRRKAVFAEGEEVIVYDLKSKLLSTGRIIEVLGNNTYLADCGNVQQHISGDVISRVSDVSRHQNGEAFVPVRHTAETDDGGEDRHSAEIDVFVDQDDDVLSISTSSTEEDSQNIIQEDIIPIVQVPRNVRRYRRNVEALGPVCGQRLRIRR